MINNNKHSKTRFNNTQAKLHNYININTTSTIPPVEASYGHEMSNINPKNIFRYIFKNPNGIQLQEPATKEGFSEVHQSNSSITGWAGTDLNYRKFSVKNKINLLAKLHSSHSKVQASYLQDKQPYPTEYQPGEPLQ